MSQHINVEGYRRLAEALARKRLESEPLGPEALLDKPQFNPFQPLTSQPPQFVSLDSRDNWFGKLDAFVRGAAGNVTFETADELSAAANAALHPLINTGNPGEDYSARYGKNLEQERATDQLDEQNRFGYRRAGQVAGSLLNAQGLMRLGATAGPLLMSKIAAQRTARRNAPTVPTRQDITKLSAASGVQGGITGLFNGFVDGKDSVQDRWTDGWQGAASNAIVGLAVTPAVARIAAAGRSLLAPTAQQIKQHTEQMIAAALEQRGGKNLRELIWVRKALDPRASETLLPKVSRRDQRKLYLEKLDDFADNAGGVEAFLQPIIQPGIKGTIFGAEK